MTTNSTKQNQRIGTIVLVAVIIILALSLKSCISSSSRYNGGEFRCTYCSKVIYNNYRAIHCTHEYNNTYKCSYCGHKNVIK